VGLKKSAPFAEKMEQVHSKDNMPVMLGQQISYLVTS
jgi:hypothetical protein